MILVLIGYMASGKSTLGRILAKQLNYEFIDLDDYIETLEGKSVSEIFKSNGEIYFRKQETFYLKALLETKNNIVLSLGGGTPCFGNNMELILNAEQAKSIYLKASIPTLVKRLNTEKSKRPLIAHIKSDEQLTEFVGKHLFERAPFYNRAQTVISTDNKTEQSIVEELIMGLF